MYIILNGEIIETSKALVSPFNRGMMYGDGCFETLKSYKGKFLGFDQHFDRLTKGLNYLGIENSLHKNELREFVDQLLQKNEILNNESIVRIQCWREGDRGYGTSSTEMGWMMQASAIKGSIKPIKLSLSKTRCISSQSLERCHKLSNGLNFIIAAQEANAKNADDALMLNLDDHISETTSANIFWLHDQTFFTPSEECDLLPGITRNLLMEIMSDQNINIETGKFSIQHLRTADAAFCCNSIKEIQEIEFLDDVQFEIGHPIINKLKRAFMKYRDEILQV